LVNDAYSEHQLWRRERRAHARHPSNATSDPGFQACDTLPRPRLRSERSQIQNPSGRTRVGDF
jgi:hypothetical protein